MRRRQVNARGSEIGGFSGLRLVEALVKVAEIAGISTDAESLTASLPTGGGDLDVRFAPFACARIDLDAKWAQRTVASLTEPHLPAVLRLIDGSFLIASAVPVGGALTIIDRSGERPVLIEEIAAAAAGPVLMIGHVDAANGSLASDQRERICANPRLWLLSSFLSERRNFLQLLMAALFLNMCAFAIPLYMRSIYDRVVPNLAVDTLWALSFGALIVLVFECVFKQVRSVFVDAIGLRVGQAIQHRAMSAVLQARIDQSNWTVGSLMTALRDIESMAMLAPQAATTFCVEIPFFFAFLALIGLIGGWVMVVPLFGAVAMILIGAASAYGLKFGSRRSSKLLQARNNLVADVVGSLHTIKSNQAEGRFLRRWDILSDHVGMNGKATRHWSEIPAVASAFIVQAVTIGIVIISIYQIRAGAMTAGALIACNMLAGRAMGPVSSAIAVVSKGYQSLTQFGALANLLALEPEVETSDAAVRARPFVGRMAFQNVGYSYPDTSVPMLRDIDLDIRPGEKIGVIGLAGSGKSTLLKLMGGLISPSSGTALVDGHAVEQYAAAHLRENIAFATQEAALFDDTIYENIVLGRTDPDPALLERAINTSGVHQFIVQSKEGLSRRVGIGGCRLSGGQRQAVVLARAFMRDPRILLLDEPTASMDIDGEQAVIRGLREFGKDRTLIIATHRFAVLDLVDRVLWMENGRIMADQPRDQLLAHLRQRQATRAA
ncbi:ATP-binding cassette domain-containing protein [Sphingomonas sp.]|uniref:ATP-binding cassette domain-containing protein n=1 Tax=Sphingomonas sp. TaxID=28214 RepID=UPI0031D1D876